MKKILLILCMIPIPLLFTGCGLNYMSSLYSKDEEISSDTNSFNFNSYGQSINGLKYTGKLEFQGVDTIWHYNADRDCDVEMSYLLSVSSGKAKLVLIDPSGELTTIIENTNNVIQEDLKAVNVSIKKGNNRIKLVAADNAQIDIQIIVSAGKLRKLGL